MANKDERNFQGNGGNPNGETPETENKIGWWKRTKQKVRNFKAKVDDAISEHPNAAAAIFTGVGGAIGYGVKIVVDLVRGGKEEDSVEGYLPEPEVETEFTDEDTYEETNEDMVPQDE